jgi:hypothetical protein
MMKLILTVFAFLSIVFIKAAAAEEKISAAAPLWEVAATYRDDNGAFDRCSMKGVYQGNLAVTIALRTDGAADVSFFRPEGFASARVQLSLYADAKLIYSGAGVPDSEGTTLSILAPLNEAGVKSLKSSALLRVASNYGQSVFTLTGASPALAELFKCVETHRQSAFGPARAKDQSRLSEDPAAAKASVEGPRAMPKEQLVSYVTEILQVAGVSNYRFLDGGDANKAGLTWQFEDGSIGSLVAVERAAGFDLDRFIAEIAMSDTMECRGDYAGGKKAPLFRNGVEIRKVFSSCNAGPRSFYAEYSLVKLPAGLLIKLTAANAGETSLPLKDANNPQSGRDRAARTEEAALAAFSRREIKFGTP